MEETKTLLDAKDLMKLYGFSRVRAYEVLNNQTLPVIRLGRRVFVRRETFDKWLDAQAGGTGE